MSAIYIISDEERALKLEYKIGINSQSQQVLLSRYYTYIPKAKIYYYIETGHARIIEDQLKELYKSKRILNGNGNLTEWIKDVQLQEIIDNIKNFFEQIRFDEPVPPKSRKRNTKIVVNTEDLASLIEQKFKEEKLKEVKSLEISKNVRKTKEPKPKSSDEKILDKIKVKEPSSSEEISTRTNNFCIIC